MQQQSISVDNNNNYNQLFELLENSRYGYEATIIINNKEYFVTYDVDMDIRDRNDHNPNYTLLLNSIEYIKVIKDLPEPPIDLPQLTSGVFQQACEHDFYTKYYAKRVEQEHNDLLPPTGYEEQY